MSPKARTPGLPTLLRVPPGRLTRNGRYATAVRTERREKHSDGGDSLCACWYWFSSNGPTSSISFRNCHYPGGLLALPNHGNVFDEVAILRDRYVRHVPKVRFNNTL